MCGKIKFYSIRCLYSVFNLFILRYKNKRYPCLTLLVVVFVYFKAYPSPAGIKRSLRPGVPEAPIRCCLSLWTCPLGEEIGRSLKESRPLIQKARTAMPLKRARGSPSQRDCSLKPMYVENVEMQVQCPSSHSACLLDTINIASIQSTIQRHRIFSHKKSSLVWTMEIYTSRYLQVHQFVTDLYCDCSSPRHALNLCNLLIRGA